MADNDRSIGAYINQNRRRSHPVTPYLEQLIAEATQAVLPPGSTFKIFSGGQTAPFAYRGRGGRKQMTSTRHNLDEQGRGQAADVYFYDKDGNQITDQVTLSKVGQYHLGKGHGGVGMTMRGGGIHLDQHTDRNPYWIYNKGSHKRASSQNIVAGARGDPGTFRPLADVPVAIKPTTPSKPKDVPLSDTPTLADFQKPVPQAPYNPNSTFKLIFPEGSQTQEAAAPQALPLQQTSPTTQLPPMKVAGMAPNIKTPKAPKLTATSESAAASLVGLIRQGKSIKGLNPDFDAATPAMQANVMRMIREAPEGDMPQLVKMLESKYPTLAQPLGKTPKAAAAPKAASPAESIVEQSIKSSDGKPVKMTKTRPSTEEELAAGPGRPPINPKGVPAKDIPAAQGDVIFDQYGRPIDKAKMRSSDPPLPPAVSPMGAAATGAAGLGIGALAGGRRNPETGVEDELPPDAGVGTGSFDDTGGMGGGSGPPNAASRTIPPGHRLGPPDGSPRPPGAAAAASPPPSDGANIANEMIERTLGLPRGSLNSPQGQQAIATIRQRIEAKAAANPAETVKRVQQAAKADAAQAAAPQQPQMRPPMGDMGGSPTSYTDRMTDLAAQNPGMAQLFQYFAGAGGE